MSGITGWVDRHRDLTRESAAVAAMTARLVRGTHGDRQWSAPHALLGHRADAPEPLGAPPAAVQEHGRTLAAITFDGVLDNATQLRSALDPPGPLITDAQLILHGYLRWGCAVAERLEGLFAFAIWDARSSELVLGRDRFGIKPLSYLPLPHGALFASEAAALGAHPLIDNELDAEGLCSLLAQVRRPGHSALRRVREVRPGHLVRLGPDGVREHRYWALEAHPHTEDLASTIATTRALLEEVIAREAAACSPAAVLLSGGLDSSTLTALVAQRAGPAPRTFTVSFGDSAATVPDRPFAQAVVDHLGCEHHEILVDPATLTHPPTLEAVLAAKDFPSPFGDKNLTPYLFYRQVAAETPVALSGEAADAVFGGLISDQERASTEHRTFPWIERARAFGLDNGIGNDLFDQDLLRGIDFTGFCAERYQEARQEVPHLPGAPADDRRAREIDYLHMTRLYEQAVNHSERLAAAAGLQVRFPFSDHRLFRYLYNVPWRMKSFDGRDKSLLRTIAADLLPASVLDRPKVPFPITYHAGYKQSLAERLREVLTDHDAPVRPLLDLPKAWQVVDDPGRLDRGGWLGRADTEMVLQLDGWLRARRIRPAL
ncbi:asparagine synthase (glutamine-hydrolyzing) [Streptomyces sp. PTM05]|uniref:asparagine synthase (glutamine-hydrolyzing) n=1 Tax=Streptantibioticus parmotrematis TaxID=2873249 RepID=A0ABS7QKK0_9ACTN|nr:asparagine synthase (glutamine-hydrolyzing) [Streptantibioticus parmotrematis]MBY8883716.1 asparagine synthase (glutamine-hydrolyzing) [Streptantibioticus parmotrematis]